METSDILPNTSFINLSPENNWYVIEDGLAEFSYTVWGFPNQVAQTEFFNHVLRRHASVFPVPRVTDGNVKINNTNLKIVLLSSTEYSNMLKDCYRQSDHYPKESNKRDRSGNDAWSGNVKKGMNSWSVTDWGSICSCLAHILPIMAIQTMYKGKMENISEKSYRSDIYRKCIELMIW